MKTILSLILTCCIFAMSSEAQELTVVDLNWTYPGEVTVVGFKAYYGPNFDYYIEMVDLSMPPFIPGDYIPADPNLPPITGGYYYYALEILTEDLPTWIVLTAYNNTRESLFSNEMCVGTEEECGVQPEAPLLGLPLNECERSDINRDGVVNGTDFILLSQNWGKDTATECTEGGN